MERERSTSDSCRFDIGRFRAELTNSERCLHPSDTFGYAVPTITCSLRYAQSTSNKMSPNLFFNMNPLGAYFINQSHDP